MTNIIDGRLLAREIHADLTSQIAPLRTRKPGLAFFLIGEDPGSLAYVGMKKKGCAEVGITSHVIQLPIDVSQRQLEEHISRYNKDPHIDGILVQQPFPKHICTEDIIQAIDPSKDVDGFHPLNLGKVILGDQSGFAPCTPLGITKLLERFDIVTSGKNVVIVGRSNIVGKPLSMMLVQKGPYANATVTLAHSQTKHLSDVCQTADILIAAMGSARFIKEHMVKNGAVVIDVGINRLNAHGKTVLVGDVDYDAVYKKCSWITPVPGGVGPMTIAMLLSNTWKSYCLRENVCK